MTGPKIYNEGEGAIKTVSNKLTSSLAIVILSLTPLKMVGLIK